MASTFDKGDLVRVDISFTNSAGDYIDPTGVVFKHKDPSENTTTLTYGDDAELVKDDTGKYYVEIDADEAGDWFVRAESTGTGQAAAESTFHVRDTYF